MGLWLTIVAINAKRDWLRNLCFSIAFIWSAIVVLRSGEMVLVTLFQQTIGWTLMFIIGYGIRFGIRYWRGRRKKN